MDTLPYHVTEKRKHMPVKYQRGRGEFFGGYAVASAISGIVVGHVTRSRGDLAKWSAYSIAGHLLDNAFPTRASAAEAALVDYVAFDRKLTT
jgi:hypothetical protein